MKERICIKCGRTYMPKSTRQKQCGLPIKLKCEWCGKEFEGICSGGYSRTTCSSECQSQLIKSKRQSSAASNVRKCKWCGEEFHPNSARTLYCDRVHYQTCKVCGKQFEIDVKKDKHVQTCSPECRYKLAMMNTDREASLAAYKQVMLEKYGVDNSAKLKSSMEKARQTNLQKYGVEHYTQTEEYREKAKQTNLKKYGTEWPTQNKEVIAKRRQNRVEKDKLTDNSTSLN